MQQYKASIVDFDLASRLKSQLILGVLICASKRGSEAREEVR